MNPEGTHRDVRNNRDDLAFQTVQELLQSALIGGHADVKAMDAIFCGHVKLLSFCMSLISIQPPSPCQDAISEEDPCQHKRESEIS
jgi:hypothetical protein